MKKLDWSEKNILETIRLFIKEDVREITANSRPGPVDPVLAKIAADAMIDLLCIRYHKEAQQNTKNYTLTYEELCEKI